MDNQKAVDAIPSYGDIEAIRDLLQYRPYELLLFELGISSGLRIKELLALKAGDISGGKYSYFLTEKNIRDAYDKYCSVWHPKPDDYVFRKLRKNEPLAFSSVTTMVKSWFAECGMEGNYTSRSLYKTWERSSVGSDGESSGLTAYALTHIDPNSVQSRVQEKLYQAIITGALPAGTKLVANRLSQQLDCNMLHIRVALAHLEEQGLVETRSAKTCVVRSLTKHDIKDISELRVLLESYAIDKVKSVWSQETGEILERIVSKWRVSEDVVEKVYFHSIFHEMLYRDLHMPILLGYIKNLADRLNSMHMTYYISNKGVKSAIDQHQEMVDLMRKGDFEGTKKSLINSIRAGEKQCIELLDELEKKKNAK